jgi:DNA modification methylase
MKSYEAFIESKSFVTKSHGFEAEDKMFYLHDRTKEPFEFQREVVKWALRRGRAAIFADTGLGKTAMQISWAQAVHSYTGNRVLIVAPLCVAQQTVKEAHDFGVTVTYVRKMPYDEYGNVPTGIFITNYEMLDKFPLKNSDGAWFDGIVLDESSILKHHTSKTRNALIESCKDIPYRLACTATPSPNDFMEIGNHAEFLGIMGYTEMLSMFFVHDGGETSKWRLKGHGRRKFFEWVSTWAVMFKTPADIGFESDAEKYLLPELEIKEHIIKTGFKTEGQLFACEASGIVEKSQAKRETLDPRIDKVRDILGQITDRPVILWCHRNDEHDALDKLSPDFATVRGSDTPENKESEVIDFVTEKKRGIISKPSIMGFGLNFQHCSDMIFTGLTDSFEELYQAIRRCYRFGQKRKVTVHLITTDIEQGTLRNLRRKQSQIEELSNEMAKAISNFTTQTISQAKKEKSKYMFEVNSIGDNKLYLGDCVDVARGLPDNSIDYSIFSPPFASLYVYSNSDRDMGNVKDQDEFFNHFIFLVKELYRVIRPGRLVSFHCMNLPTSKERDGYIGIRDFRGNLIRAFQDSGFIYHSEVCIWKDPVTAMQRTKALGLLHKQIRKDSSMNRMGIPDYVVTMRKPGENTKPIAHDAKEFPVDLWQKIASPIWMDINPSNTLNYRAGRENDDERHICPLQLEVIIRCLALYSAKGDLVFSPFMGVGSEGYCAVKHGRNFIGSELKASYYKQAVKNIEDATRDTIDLFSIVK